MDNPRVLCLGEILFDCLADQLGLPLEQVQSWTPYPGGAPANVATALVKLGVPSGFIGCIGKDKSGDVLVNILHTSEVDITGVQRHPTAPSRAVYVVRSTSGDRTFAGFGDFDTSEFADTRLQADKLPEDLFVGADFLVLGTLELAYPESGKAVYRALDLAQKHGVKVLLDVNWRPVFWKYPHLASGIIKQLFRRVDIIKLAREEAMWLFNTAEPGAIIRQLKNNDVNLAGVIITDGGSGCAYSFGGNEARIQAFSVPVVDTTGAGDSFVAGFIQQLLTYGFDAISDSSKMKKMVTYASAVGALTTTKPGAIAAQPKAAEVEAFLTK